MDKFNIFNNKKDNSELTPWEKYQNESQKNLKVSFIRDKKIIKLNRLNVKENKKLIEFLTILFFLSIFLIINIYFVSPFSKIADVKINGNDIVSETTIKKRFKLNKHQFILHIYHHDKKIERKIKHAYPQFKKVKLSIHHFNHVNLTLSKYRTAGYLQTNGGEYEPILSNGIILHKSINNLKTGIPVLKLFNKKNKLKMMLQQYKELPINTQNMISYITFEPTSINYNRIHLYMNDGNQVYASIPSLADKMQYYNSISSKSKKPQVINFELGAYSYQLNESKKSVKNKVKKSNPKKVIKERKSSER